MPIVPEDVVRAIVDAVVGDVVGCQKESAFLVHPRALYQTLCSFPWSLDLFARQRNGIYLIGLVWIRWSAV
jgi:hypothetical protein